MSEMQHSQWDFVEVRVMTGDDIDRWGFPVRSMYVEALWLPVLGPSATWALRRLAGMAEHAGASGEVFWLDLGRFSVELGLGGGVGQHSIVRRTLRRLVHFGLATWEDDVLIVRRAVPPLSAHQLQRLPSNLCRMHDTLLGDWADHTTNMRNNTEAVSA